MSIAQVPYSDPTRVSAGQQADGLGFIRATHQIFDGWATGDISLGYEIDVYAGATSWADGSIPVASQRRQVDARRLRNALRGERDAFLAVLRAIESAVAAEIGGVAVVDPVPPWLDAPAESLD